jgi:hypothetical protein
MSKSLKLEMQSLGTMTLNHLIAALDAV